VTEYKFCHNCGTMVCPEGHTLGDMPLEHVVAQDDEIRLQQLQAIRAGRETRHSIAIAANKEVSFQ
jgi:hypothetical protein